MQKSHLIKSATQHIDPRLNQHIRWLAKISSWVNQALEPKLRPHIQVANVNQDRLILLTSTGVWATALRFRTPELLEKLRAYPELAHINKIESIVRPEVVPHKSPARTQLKISKKTADSLHNIANTISDVNLSRALHKIANHVDQ